MRSIRVICVLIFVRIGEPLLGRTALKIALVNRETGRPVDREGERRGSVSLVSWSTGFLVFGLLPATFSIIHAGPPADLSPRHVIIPSMSTAFPTHSSLRRRIHRGLEGLFGPFQPVDESPARALLPPEALALFQRMSRADRAHSLRVYGWLVERGYDQRDLLVAALLHDCGKAAARLAVWQRTLKVLLKTFAPAWWRKLSAPASPKNWRYPFYVLQAHPQIGATWARQTGCSELTCWLIAGHEQTPPSYHPHADLMWALQFADAAS